jgi:hypothetical protein
VKLKQMRRQLAWRERLFRLITEKAADRIAVVAPMDGVFHNNPELPKDTWIPPRRVGRDFLHGTRFIQTIQVRVLEAAQKAHLTGRGDLNSRVALGQAH